VTSVRPLICVLGDAHLDVVARVSWPPAEETDTPASTHVGVGGQGANVAAWVAALGGRSRLIAARGTDAGAQLVAAELAARGVDLVGPVLTGRTGVVISLSDAGRRRSMLTDRGVGTELTTGDIRPEWFDGCDWLHLTGYGFAAGPLRAAVLTAARAASARAARLSIDLSSTAVIEQVGVGAFRDWIAGLRPHVVFGDRAEAELVRGVLDDRLIVKLGQDGVQVADRHFPATVTAPVDSTGAGDAFAAGYLLGGVELGLSAAARAVAKMGAMP